MFVNKLFIDEEFEFLIDEKLIQLFTEKKICLIASRYLLERYKLKSEYFFMSGLIR